MNADSRRFLPFIGFICGFPPIVVIVQQVYSLCVLGALCGKMWVTGSLDLHRMQIPVYYLDSVFALHEGTLIFYGHNHSKSDMKGRARYVNPVSLGCYNQAIARYCVAEFHRGQYTVEYRGVPYDDTELFKAFEQRDVPEREFIYRVFFGGRFQTKLSRHS